MDRAMTQTSLEQSSYVRCPVPASSVRARLHQVCRRSFKIVELGREQETARTILRVDFESADDQEAFRAALAQKWAH